MPFEFAQKFQEKIVGKETAGRKDFQDFIVEKSAIEIEELKLKTDKLADDIEKRNKELTQTVFELRRLFETKSEEYSRLEGELQSLRKTYYGGLSDEGRNLLKLFVSALAKNRKSREMKIGIKNKEDELARIGEEREMIVRLLSDAEDARNSGSLFKEIDEQFDRFLIEQESKFKEHEEETELESAIAAITEQKRLSRREGEIRDVRKNSEDHGCLFVHKFTYQIDDRSQITVLKPGTRWQQMFDIALVLSPELACSSLRAGNDAVKTFGQLPLGIILKDGVITSASDQDSASAVSGLSRGKATKLERAEREINFSIGKKKRGYNEIHVADGKIGGVFLESEAGGQFSKASKDSTTHDVSELHAELRRHLLAVGIGDLPIYIKDESNNFYRTEIITGENGDFQRYAKKERTSNEEILADTFELDGLKVDSIEKNLFVDSPFKFDNPDFRAYQTWQIGRKLFQIFQNKEKPENMRELQFGDLRERRRKDVDLGGMTVFLEDAWQKKEGDATVEELIEALSASLKSDFKKLSADEAESLRGEDLTDVSRNRIKENTENCKRKWLFFMLGLGEQAKRAGLDGAYRKCLASVADFISEKEYNDFIRRRTGENDRWIARKEDLKNISTKSF